MLNCFQGFRGLSPLSQFAGVTLREVLRERELWHSDNCLSPSQIQAVHKVISHKSKYQVHNLFRNLQCKVRSKFRPWSRSCEHLLPQYTFILEHSNSSVEICIAVPNFIACVKQGMWKGRGFPHTGFIVLYKTSNQQKVLTGPRLFYKQLC